MRRHSKHPTAASSGIRSSRARGRIPRRRADLPFYGPLALFWAIIVAKAWVTRWIVVGDPNPLRALLLEGGIILVALVVAGLVVTRGRLWAYLAVDAVFSIIFVVSAVYVAQFEQLPTPETLSLVTQLGAVQESVWSLLHVWYAWYFVDIVVLAVLLGVTSPRRQSPPTRRDSRLLGAAVLAIIWGGIVVGLVALGGPIADSQAGAKARGMLAFQLASSSKSSEDAMADGAVQAGRVTKPVDYTDAASVQQEIDRLQGSLPASRVAGAPSPGAFAGKNVIVIQLEAMMPLLIGAKFSGQEVTPNLNRLVKQSWYAPSMFMQMGKGNTSDVEFVSNTSLLTRQAEPASAAWGGKEIPSLPRLLRAQGYPAYTFHANAVTFWRRDRLYPALGFSAYRDRAFYGVEDKIGMGASDAAFYRKTLPILEGLGKKGPFYSQLVSLSAHHPFMQVSTRSDYAVPERIRATPTGRYIKAQHYADGQLGVFIQKLKDDGLWDDSVIVIYGDHFGPSFRELKKPELDVLSDLVGHEYTVLDHFRVPLVIHVPGQKVPGRITGSVGQIDIMPTIVELLGLDASRLAMFGRSIFSGGSPIVPLRYYAPEGTFVTDDVFFRPGIGYDDATARRISDGAPIPGSSVPIGLYNRATELLAVNERYLTARPALSATATIGSR